MQTALYQPEAGSRCTDAPSPAPAPQARGEQLALFRARPGLTVINCGMGRDSVAMLCLLAEGRLVCDGRVLAPGDVDAVIFSDTDAEWPGTYAAVPRVRALCERMGVRFLVLAKPPEWGPQGWRTNQRPKGSKDLPVWVQHCPGSTIEERARLGYYHRRLPIIEEYARFQTIAVTVSASCTANHKVLVIRRVLDDLCRERFGVSCVAWGNLARAGAVERHRVLIGIAADEADRAIDSGRPYYEQVRYPLVEMGVSKADEAPILARHGLDDLHKSGCFICPYQPAGWFWALSELYPELFARAVAYEAAALERNPKMWVLGSTKRPLPEAVAAWRARNPDATHESVLAKSYCRSASAWGAAEKSAA